jgi:hypothetical protein
MESREHLPGLLKPSVIKPRNQHGGHGHPDLHDVELQQLLGPVPGSLARNPSKRQAGQRIEGVETVNPFEWRSASRRLAPPRALNDLASELTQK